jgi:hypothetical protein
MDGKVSKRKEAAGQLQELRVVCGVTPVTKPSVSSQLTCP